MLLGPFVDFVYANVIIAVMPSLLSTLVRNFGGEED